MDRVILVALLCIPILVIMHVALFRQDLPPAVAMLSISGGSQERPTSQDPWLTPERAGLPGQFVIKQTSERGS